MPLPLVVSVILNTNHCEDTLQCITSLEKNTYANHQIILLDNASTDGSVEKVRSLFPAVEIIQLKENRGYAGNNNVGIKAAVDRAADWVFVLNEDTILDPECIAQLVSTGESDPTIGIVGPLVYHFNEPTIIQSAGGQTNKTFQAWHLGQDELDQGQYPSPHPVDWISGCGIMVRKAVIDQVGAIDERFFYYVEEFEWCYRAKKAGWKLINVPQAKLWHKGVQRNNKPKPAVTYYATRNRLLLLLKHKAPLAIWVSIWAEFIRTLTSWTIKPKWKSMRPHRDAMWHGIVDFVYRRWGQMS